MTAARECSPIAKALTAQCVATIVPIAILRLSAHAPSPLALAFLQGAMAAACAALLRSDRWWLPLHLCFVPAIVLLTSWSLPAWIYALALLALLLVFGASHRSQVPLFLSNAATVARFAAWLPRGQALRILDAGSGTGSFASALAGRRPDCSVVGIEQAWLPSWLGRLRARGSRNLQMQRGDLWQQSFAGFDVVYVFLSPVPMPRIWEKASAELHAGAWLVSNSFAVPDRVPDEVIDVGDRRGTRLYCYRR